MTLWALRGAILGKGPWLLIHSEKHLDRLRNTPRKRNLTSHELGEGIQEMSQLPYFNAYDPLLFPPPPYSLARCYPR